MDIPKNAPPVKLMDLGAAISQTCKTWQEWKTAEYPDFASALAALKAHEEAMSRLMELAEALRNE